MNERFKSEPRKAKEIISTMTPKMTDSEYVELIERYRDKSFAQINEENPEFASELIQIFNIVENQNRRHGRKYNEVLVTRPKIQGVFAYDRSITQVPKYLRQYAADADIPVVIFMD